MRCLLKFSLISLLALALSQHSYAFEREAIRLDTAKGSITIGVKLAITPAERKQTLVGRDDFGPGDAMLFIYPGEQRLSFWMKGTPVSLDIIFFDGKGAWLNTAYSTIPFSLDSYSSVAPGRYVLEVAAGEAKRLGIGEGTLLLGKAGP